MVEIPRCRQLSTWDGSAHLTLYYNIGATVTTGKWGHPNEMRSNKPRGSIPVLLDLQQREGAQRVRRVGRWRRAHVGAVELGVFRDPQQAERALHLVFEEFEHAHDTGLPRRREPVALHAAEP